MKGFAPFFGSTVGRSAGVFPPINIYDDGQAFLLRAEAPGLEKDSIEVSVRGDQVTLRGDRHIETPSSAANYHRRERESGQFRRVVTLPQAVDADHISANYKNGLLEILLPRIPEAQPRKIAIH